MTAHLTADQRAALAKALKERATALEQQLALHGNDSGRAASAVEPRERDRDAAQLAGEREVDMALSEIDVRELAAVRQALQRLQSEGYGVCAACNRPIPFARLSVEPQAARCVACESIHERSL